MAEKKLDISPLGDCQGQIRPEGFVWENGCYRPATRQEMAILQPVRLEDLIDKLPVTINRRPWARKMGPQ